MIKHKGLSLFCLASLAVMLGGCGTAATSTVTAVESVTNQQVDSTDEVITIEEAVTGEVLVLATESGVADEVAQGNDSLRRPRASSSSPTASSTPRCSESPSSPWVGVPFDCCLRLSRWITLIATPQRRREGAA